MDIEEIRRNKPDGATHYTSYDLTHITVVQYFKYVGSNLYRYCTIYGEWVAHTAKQTLDFKERFKPL